MAALMFMLSRGGHIGVTNIRWVRRSKHLRAVRVFGLMFKTSEALNDVGLFRNQQPVAFSLLTFPSCWTWQIRVHMFW